MQARARAHARTHARAHTHTHTHTQGFVMFAVGFNAVAGLMHKKLPDYLLVSV